MALLTQDQGRFDHPLPVTEQLVALAKRTEAGSDKLPIDFQMYAGVLLTMSGKPSRARADRNPPILTCLSVQGRRSVAAGAGAVRG